MKIQEDSSISGLVKNYALIAEKLTLIIRKKVMLIMFKIKMTTKISIILLLIETLRTVALKVLVAFVGQPDKVSYEKRKLNEVYSASSTATSTALNISVEKLKPCQCSENVVKRLMI